MVHGERVKFRNMPRTVTTMYQGDGAEHASSPSLSQSLNYDVTLMMPHGDVIAEPSCCLPGLQTTCAGPASTLCLTLTSGLTHDKVTKTLSAMVPTKALVSPDCLI